MGTKKVNSYKLDDIVRKDVFTVPDKYFEELPQRIQNRIGESNLTATKKQRTRNKLFLLVVVLLFALQTDGSAQRRQSNKKVVIVKNSPPRGTRVAKIDRRHVVIIHRGVDYRYVNGVFYQPFGVEFLVVPPPIGIRVRVLPKQHQTIVINGRMLYYANGAYYNQAAPDEYEVVQPPVGARVEALPEGAQSIIVNAQKLYVLDGVYYKEVIVNNNLMYEVVSKGQVEVEPALTIGAQYDSLPADHSVVVISGEKLYLANGVYYKEVVVGNELRYEVVGID